MGVAVVVVDLQVLDHLLLVVVDFVVVVVVAAAAVAVAG